MPFADVPGEIETRRGPGPLSHQIHQREPSARVVVGNLDVVGRLPDRAALELEKEARSIAGVRGGVRCSEHCERCQQQKKILQEIFRTSDKSRICYSESLIEKTV